MSCLESLVFLWLRRVYGGKLHLSILRVSNQIVMLFCVAGLALRDIETCFVTCQESFCVARAVLLCRFHKMSCSSDFSSRRSATLHTLHSTLYTLHFTLYIPHFTLHTPHFTHYTIHFKPHTLHSTLYTPYFALHTLHITLHTLHSTLYTPHSTLYTLHSTL